MKKLLFAAILAASFTGQAQLGGLLKKSNSKLQLNEEESITLPQRMNNIGKIVFSNEELERELPESKYITTYTFGDKLTMRAWLANSPANSQMLQLEASGIKAKEINANRSSFDGGMTKVLFILYLDGQKVTNTSYASNFKEKDMGTVPSVRADLNDGTDELYFGETLFIDLKRKQDLLTPGKHKLRIELVPIKTFAFGSDFDYKPIAVGELDMIVKDKPIDPNDPEACLPKAGMTNKELEAKILALYKKKFPKDTPKGVRITSTKWNIVKHEYTGIPLRKFISATIGRSRDGKCSYDEFSFTQDYDGNQYDELYLSGEGIGTQREISCKCFK